MKMFALLAGALTLAVIGSGCAPELDQTQLSPEEQLWAKTFKENYSGWQAPEAMPRGVRRDDVPEVAPVAAPDAPIADAATVPVNGDVADAPVPVAGEPEVVTPAPVATADETYVVAKGDTLGKIALKLYGKASAWKKIQNANADLLKGKTVIKEGMKLKIPRP